MTIGTLKSPNPRNPISISVIKSKFLSISSMNTLLAILKVIDARREVVLDFLGDTFSLLDLENIKKNHIGPKCLF